MSGEHVQYALASSSAAVQETQFGHLEVALNLNVFLLQPWQQLKAALSPFVLEKNVKTTYSIVVKRAVSKSHTNLASNPSATACSLTKLASLSLSFSTCGIEIIAVPNLIGVRDGNVQSILLAACPRSAQYLLNKDV